MGVDGWLLAGFGNNKRHLIKRKPQKEQKKKGMDM